ncbi:MAG: hypothetical protein PUG00_07535 [Clostridiales bacterium]|nr:hypothetical protein [Clostridiales bacterium]
MIQNDKYRFYIIGTGSDYVKFMWKDALLRSNVFYLDTPIKENFPLKRIYDNIEQKQYSYKLNLYMNSPGKSIWRKYYSVNEIEFDANYSNIIIFSDAMRILTDRYFWHKMKKKYNLSYCLILLNSCEHDISTNKNIVNKILKAMGMDWIYSFDQQDSVNYGLKYFPSLYSNCNVPVGEKKYDFYFVGKKKNRYKNIIDTYYKLKNMGYRCLFRITDVDDKDIINDEGLKYNEYIPYVKVIEEISQSNGIVDVKIPEQDGLSLRYFEAVQYNKILLTNNSSVKNTPYYNSDYMHLFNKVDEIPQLLKYNKKNVNYKYDGRYSPNKLLQMIQEGME